jgi:hypothetical protein
MTVVQTTLPSWADIVKGASSATGNSSEREAEKKSVTIRKYMEDERKIQELTCALKTLKLQEAELTAQLKKAIENKEKKRDEELVNTYEASTRRASKRGEQSFHRGDRIWIKNKLHKPATWNNKIEWNEKEGKTATVTEVIVRGPGEQVHFLTDNGVRTWRAPNNVCLITPTERNDE